MKRFPKQTIGNKTEKRNDILRQHMKPAVSVKVIRDIRSYYPPIKIKHDTRHKNNVTTLEKQVTHGSQTKITLCTYKC